MATPKKATSKSPKKRSKRASNAGGDSDEDGQEIDLPDGTRIVGKVVEAPKTGRVPPGQISQNTFNFLNDLKKPECNDRGWFRLHEPVYRLAEKEFKDFVDECTSDLVAADPQIPHLPPKDVIHRIYRDIRFSNDKTPYKTGFSASFSRAGRKGDFAGFKPGDASLIAGGSWCPPKDKLALIRRHIVHDPQAFRNLISAPDFVALFGAPEAHADGERQNVFGVEDQLKTAPKGYDKNHPAIDLLRLRSFAVVHKFPDSEVLAADFRERLARAVGVMRPFVHR
ncbi:hypothetical protein AURDEDRAFT_90263 [Auricularia subglabra TFB-10046 SS5]|nr:hypothetical protein AURDEDRAFT_90263 [Auricularia subglabra TFB-10046 SS5]